MSEEVSQKILDFSIHPAGASETATVRRQLERTDAEISAVARHCRFGYPQVIFHPPWHAGRIHPSLFWLSCPWLVQLIDQYESTRCIKALEEELRDDRGLADRFRREQKEFNRYLARQSREIPLPANVAGRLRGLHVGGSADPLTVKCMHAHLAVTLAGHSTVPGRRALAWLREEHGLELSVVLGKGRPT